jgi:N-methylhydantoinase A
MLAVHTVGAGGGSIAWRDPGGALRVGPRSAGADPGPACYGRGGTEATVTDANLVLGYLGADAPLAGGVELDLGAAQAAVDRLAASLELDPIACAEGILRVANAEMVRALRVVTVERGIDPRDYALLAFGGAGPLHATEIAEELGIDTVLCPRASGVLAALGLVVSERRRDAQRTVLMSGERLSAESVGRVVQELAERARRELGEAESELRATYELRYEGQSFELPVAAGTTPTPDELRRSFEEEHESRYGYSDPDRALELVTIRVTATSPGVDVALAAADEPGVPAPGTEIEGPTVIALPESTVRVPESWAGSVDQGGTIRLERR